MCTFVGVVQNAYERRECDAMLRGGVLSATMTTTTCPTSDKLTVWSPFLSLSLTLCLLPCIIVWQGRLILGSTGCLLPTPEVRTVCLSFLLFVESGSDFPGVEITFDSGQGLFRMLQPKQRNNSGKQTSCSHTVWKHQKKSSFLERIAARLCMYGNLFIDFSYAVGHFPELFTFGHIRVLVWLGMVWLFCIGKLWAKRDVFRTC